MSFARRLRLGFSPAPLAMLALSGMPEFCPEPSGETTPGRWKWPLWLEPAFALMARLIRIFV